MQGLIPKISVDRHKKTKSISKRNAERIGIPNSCLNLYHCRKKPVELQTEFSNHEDAIKMVIETLLNEKYGVIKDMSEINGRASSSSWRREIFQVCTDR